MERDKTAPVFVKISDYKEVLDIIDVLKKKLKDTNNQLLKIKELKNEEDQEIQEWESNLEEISKKISFIDNAFFENE